MHFLGGQSAEQPTAASLTDLPNIDAVYDDAAEWGPQPWRRGASILHIELRRWADVLVVARTSSSSSYLVLSLLSIRYSLCGG